MTGALQAIASAAISDQDAFPEITCELTQGQFTREVEGEVAWFRANDKITWFHIAVSSAPPVPDL